MADGKLFTRLGLALAAAAVLVLAACSQKAEPTSDPATETTLTFPYPPFEIHTDVAVPVTSPPLLDAAKFALEMSVDDRLKNIPGNDEIERRFRSRIAPQADITDSPPAANNFVGATGGALHRVVGVRDMPDGKVEVTVCLYDTPGLYAKSKAGKLVGPDPNRPYSLQRPLVEWTDRPAADGTTPTGPRWLWVGEARTYDMTLDQISAVCGPFKPEPFVQKMPDPTSTTVTPAP